MDTSANLAGTEDDLLVDVSRACGMLSISRGYLYQLVKRGDVEMVKLGRRSLFTKSSLVRFVESLPKAS